MDTDGSGSIDTQELRSALALGGLDLSLPPCSQLVRSVDRDYSDNVSLQVLEGCA